MTSNLTLIMYDDIGTELAQIAVVSRPLGGAEITVPARLVDPRRGARFALATADARRWLYRAGPPRIERGKAVYILRPDRMGPPPGAPAIYRSW